MSAVPRPQPRLARLHVDQVHAMLEAGILRDRDPIELIDGVLVYKDKSAHGEDPITIGTKHNVVVSLLIELHPELKSFGCFVQTQGVLSLPPYSEPEPDGAILHGTPRDYLARLPLASDAEVVIEVSDSSLEYDRTTKLSMYARAGIRQYAIVNLQDTCIELHVDPQGEAYRSSRILRRGDDVVLTIREGRTLRFAAERLLP
jgi:hypothetical protein